MILDHLLALAFVFATVSVAILWFGRLEGTTTAKLADEGFMLSFRLRRYFSERSVMWHRVFVWAATLLMILEIYLDIF